MKILIILRRLTLSTNKPNNYSLHIHPPSKHLRRKCALISNMLGRIQLISRYRPVGIKPVGSGVVVTLDILRAR
jgi:hypothetical protein